MSFTFALLAGIALSISLAWIWWSYWVVLWKIEGLDKVKDVHLLYERAISGRLIWPRGHLCERTEFRFGDKAHKLAKLEGKLEQPRRKEWIIDDKIPDEYVIPVKRLDLYIGIFISVSALVFFLVLKNPIVLICFLILAAFRFWAYFNERKKGPEFMKLTEDMLEVNGLPIPWEEVRGFDLRYEIESGGAGHGPKNKAYLGLRTSPESFGFQKIDIARANASRSRIEFLMDVFHHRYLMKSQNQSEAT
ncbi:MAG: hypothetical protein AAF696_31280 [Bacteroidota bacterium]